MRARAWLAVVAAVVLSVGARAAGTLSPTSGSIGTVITVSGLGTNPPRGTSAKLVPAAVKRPKSFPLKVVSRDEGGLTVQVRKATVGVYSVEMRFPGQNPSQVTADDLFEVAPPAIDSLSATAGAASLPLDIRGHDFGTSRGKVTIGGRKALVKTWDGFTIRVIVPRGLAAGPQPVVVLGKAGTSEEPVTYDVITGEFLRFDFDGHHFELTQRHPTKFVAGYDGNCQCVTIYGASRNRRFGVGLFNVILADSPQTIGPAYSPTNPYATGNYRASNTAHLYSVDVNSAWSVSITSWSGGILDGTFSGPLDGGPGFDVLDVTNGAFHVHLNDPGP